MKKILFLIHDLGVGGAEKVLVNLVNNMDRSKFDITVISLFGGGVNEQFLKPDIHYHSVYKKNIPANSHWMKLFTPRQLHKMYIKDTYDIEVSYLEGPSARIISGCQNAGTKLVSWIHVEQHTAKRACCSFRSKKEAEMCYQKFDHTVCVSDYVKRDFQSIFHITAPVSVLYNTNETTQIIQQSQEPVEGMTKKSDTISLIGVGKILPNKGFDRLARIHVRLIKEGYAVHTYVLGVGPEQPHIEDYCKKNEVNDTFTFLGYQTNPYKYVSKCDLFVCTSLAEGFSTAATEALIVGTPVCTVEVSGMKEMLGDHDEYGIVTPNDEDALYMGIKKLIDDPLLLSYYKNQAEVRGKVFSTKNTVMAVEKMLLDL